MIISKFRQDTEKRKSTRLTPHMSCKGRIAQSVEQGIENPRVGGSIPPPATIFIDLQLDYLAENDR